MARTASRSSLPTTGNPIVDEAREFYNKVSEWESDARARFIADIKFANADSINGYQWVDAKQYRDLDKRPSLTLNVVRQHNLQIINAARQAKSQIKVRALGNGATQDSANVVAQLIRHVEYQSRAQELAYTTARQFQVDGGRGWWRLITDYASPDTFDQEIYIKEIWDPLSVFMDPDCQRADCLDSRRALVFDSMVPRDQFEDAYPEYAELASNSPLGSTTVTDDLAESEHVMVVEYFRRVPVVDELLSFVYEGERTEILKSEMPLKVWQDIRKDPLTKWRRTVRDKIEWYLIAGETIIDQTEWPGKFIPLICCIGHRTIIDGQVDWKGHTRALRSAQLMYNWNASQQVEYGATQGKTPWIAPAKAIEEYEQYWNTANTVNHSVLPYNDVDDENPERTIAPPMRAEPPNFAPLYEKGMETAFNQMMMVSGQWQNQMGMLGNERTGKAIQERQEQGDTSTFHFQDNYNSALITTAIQLIDLFPKIYDTRRVIMIQAEDGSDEELQIDPQAQQALAIQRDQQNAVVARVFNPALGAYEIAPDVGPPVATKRQQTADALTLILTQAPGLTGIIGDLLLESLEFDKAQEAAQRLRRMVPPEALGTGPSQKEQQLTQVVQALQQALAKSLDAHGKDRVKLVGKDQMRDIDAYEAETNRMKALADMLPMDQPGLEQIIGQLVEEAMKTSLLPIIEANTAGIGEEAGAAPGAAEPPAEQPPIPGAAKAPDGEWYILDPTRRSRYLRIGPLATQGRPPARGPTSG